MKQVGMIAALATALLFTTTTKAQTTDYFPGKWKVTVYGTPNGDAVMFFNLIRTDGKLGGTFSDSTEKEKTKLTSVEEKDTTVTLYFSTQGYDVNVELNKRPADSVKGNLMGMFDVKGVRVKENPH
jgi:hypothetical protein